MLTKVLFTAAIIAIVVAIYRIRAARIGSYRNDQPQRNAFGLRVTYGFVALLIVIGGVFYFLHWRNEHRVVTIRVFDSQSGSATVYKAYRKSIQGLSFQSLDGKLVKLGEADRVEMIEEPH